jgi:Methyltransferase domain
MHSRKRHIAELRKAGFDPVQIANQLQLRTTLVGCQSVLDIGCGPASPLRFMGFERLVGVEGYLPGYEAAKSSQTHHDIVFGDVRDLEAHFTPKSFEACVALDLIEHLAKEDGLRLMNAMEKIASKRVVFFTPNGFLPQQHADDADLQLHLSGWEAWEMRKNGYRVLGSLGPKFLRGEGHQLKYRPRAFWAGISLVGQCLITRWLPEHAAAILCVKEC